MKVKKVIGIAQQRKYVRRKETLFIFSLLFRFSLFVFTSKLETEEDRGHTLTLEPKEGRREVEKFGAKGP